MDSRRPFRAITSWARPALAALLLLSAASSGGARAQTNVQAAVAPERGSSSASTAAPAPQTAQTTGVNGATSADPARSQDRAPDKPQDKPQDKPSEPRSLTAKAIDTVKQVARSASDIFSRVPCLPPKGSARPMGSLPHVAGKLAAGDPVVIVAFGSSSTQGWGSSSPEFTYPNRLARQLRRQYPSADIRVINAGKGGEDAPQMMNRLQTAVLDQHPDLVIWQVGTNAVLRNLDPAETAKSVEEGIARIQAAGSDIVLVDPQYSPRMTERAESAGRMVRVLGHVAELRHIGIFPRFEVMRDWHERQAIPIDSFVISDGLHMNDWGYACFAQLLGDDIIRSVGQIKLGIAVPANVQAYRPM